MSDLPSPYLTNKKLPPAHNGCQCSCHKIPGIIHVIACCRSTPSFAEIKLPVRTTCACCFEYKETPLKLAAFGGFVCLACVERNFNLLANAVKPFKKLNISESFREREPMNLRVAIDEGYGYSMIAWSDKENFRVEDFRRLKVLADSIKG